MTDEVQDRTDRLAELISEVSYVDSVTLIDIDGWTTGHIVSLIEELDAELQRRYDETTAEQEERLLKRLH
jgi:hypothetical protein